MSQLLEDVSSDKNDDDRADVAPQQPDTTKPSQQRRKPTGRNNRSLTFAASLLLVLAIVAVLVGVGYTKWIQIQSAISEPPPPEMPVAVRLVPATAGKLQPLTNVVG
ncbi:MAG: hypothetical protein AAF745_17365, partial [Planctomycetota bacterium]